MVLGLWLNEGASLQRAPLLGSPDPYVSICRGLKNSGGSPGKGLADSLAEEVEARGGAKKAAAIIGDIRVVPEFLGNRAPFCRP